MKKKRNNWLYRLLYALPFGMKAADKEIAGDATISNEGQTVIKEVADERVGQHMLKGELTQSVKELRYRTYKVDDESKKFEYTGNGTALKKASPKLDRHHIRFSQECKLLTSNVLDDLKHVGSCGTENYTLQISYNNPLVRFKFEEFATQIDIDIDTDQSRYLTTLHFSNIPNGYEKKSAPFINELKRLINIAKNLKALDFNYKKSDNLNEVYKHNEMASSMLTLNFTTFKATNDEPDLIVYTFINPHVYDAVEENCEIKITFKWDDWSSTDLKAKFFDATMAQKYAEKAPKNASINIANADRVAYCNDCGKKISVYDADITKYTFGKAMCKECLEKYLNEIKKKASNKGDNNSDRT